MRVKDLVQFSKEKCFNGAVQTDWFYDESRVQNVAESYVFHGPKYFGVSNNDVVLSGHKLIDTATFALNIATKLTDEHPDNCFIMTIAGYGAGKSHLAVSLAALFSDMPNVAQTVIHNIENVDKSIAQKIKEKNRKRNLVIVLNGMNNFNLDAEVLKNVRIVLSNNGISDEVLKPLTKTYDVARQFVDNTFESFQEKYNISANQQSVTLRNKELKDYLKTNIEANSKALSIINTVYYEITGTDLSWERGISAGDVLTTLYSTLCGDNKPFNKVLVLFDEFGRYIEYAAANPAIAGEAALQQIFESVQSANGGIIFTGFVQSELDAYLSRIEKTSNIMRYVGRYKASENLFLSSNFETILANLLVKVDERNHSRVVTAALEWNKNSCSYIESSLMRWDKSKIKKDVWTNHKLYESIIQKGCYPLHPITVWLLSNMHEWMQQRSAITFAAEMVERIAEIEIEELALPYIYPVDIVDSGIFYEMLNSEEKGLIQSQNCMLYRDIIVKTGDKLDADSLNVLKATLVINIGRFSFSSREDAISALKYCSNLDDEKKLEETINKLENYYGVISFDESTNSFDLVADANGFNEFRRIYAKYKMSTNPACINDLDDTLREKMHLNKDLETSFSQQHHISSKEWRFSQIVIDSSDITRHYIESLLRENKSDYSGEEARGMLLFAYCSQNADQEVQRIASLYKNLALSVKPIIIVFLDDSEGEILSALTGKAVINKFSKADYERFEKHILAQKKAKDKIIDQKFRLLVQERYIITEQGLVQYAGRLNSVCTEKFEKLFYRPLTFMFDGFENKTQAAAKRYLSNICTKMFDRTLLNIQSYNALSTDEKNRIRATLSVGTNTSWQVYTNNCTFTKPVDGTALEVFNAIDSLIEEDKALNVMKLFEGFIQPPYGMNMNSISLFLFYYIAYKEKTVLCFYGDEKLKPSHLSDKIFKGSKLQIKEFIKIRLQKNVNVDRDLVKDLCETIMGCVKVEECPGYKKRLLDLLAQEGISTENQLLVASSQARLDDGIALRDKIYGEISKGDEIIEASKGAFKIQDFMKVFNYYVNTEGLVSEGLPFVYSDHFKSRMLELDNKTREMMDRHMEDAIKKFSCKITQLSQFKKICNKYEKTFARYGYDQFAELIKTHALETEEELLAKQKYETTLVDFDRDIAMIPGNGMAGYEQYAVILEKMYGWRNFFESITDMPTRLLQEQKNRNGDAIQVLENRIREISITLQSLISSLQQERQYEGILLLEEKLTRISSLGLNDEDQKVANDALRSIASLKKFTEEIPENIDGIKQTLNMISKDEFGICFSCAKQILEQRALLAEEKQTRWIEQYIIPIEKSVNNMTIAECSNWLDKTKDIPTTFDTDTISRYSSASELVLAQLHKSRVKGVLIMYEKLDEDEKHEFRKMIANT